MADRLDAALADLATAVEFPPTPDLRRGVGDRLAQPARRPAWSWPLRRALILAVVALLALATAAVGLGLVPGLRLTFVAPSELPSAPIGEGLELGDAVPVGDVAAHVPAALGPPAEAYVSADGRVASLVYPASDELPALAGSDIGLLVQAFEGALDREQIEKLVEVGSSVTPVSVDGASGYWIAGPPHALRYLDATGRSRAEETRLVGDTLVWADGGTLYRIESGLGMAETLRIAETIGD